MVGGMLACLAKRCRRVGIERGRGRASGRVLAGLWTSV